jgi:hypothetical protein
VKRLRHHFTIVNGVRLAIISLLALIIAGSTMSASSPGGPAKGRAALSANGNASVKKGTKPLWSELTPAQQDALKALEPEWDHINGVRKKKWLEIGDKIAAMNPEEKQRIQERLREWVKLTPEQRNRARQNFTQAKKMDPEEKTTQWQQYQQLPEEQKQKLAASAQTKKQVVNPPSEAQRNKEVVAPIKLPPKPGAESSASRPPDEQPLPPYWK